MLGRVYIFLSKINPTAILLIYLALIPVFAGVFYCLKRPQFYAPYAHLEPAAISDADVVKNNLTASMMRSYRSHENTGDGWHIAHSDVKTDNLTVDASNGLAFTVYFFATKQEKGRIVESIGGPQFTGRLSQQKIVTEQRPKWTICHLISLPNDLAEGGPLVFDKRLLFRPPETVVQADAICWGGEEELAFENLVAGWAGDPRGLSGYFGRMLYFSATTMTTVGFGDIVPLTSTARALVALEPIIGWVLAGLFLNSLATRIGRNG